MVKMVFKESIYLVGMMGAGKSYWATQIALALDLPFIDLDASIETITGLSVSDIFSKHGEQYFRKQEREALLQTSTHKPVIVATGGGTPCFYENMQWMKKNGITIWLDSTIPTMIKRLQKDNSVRPLLKDVAPEKFATYLESILEARLPFYSQSMIRLDESEHRLEIILKKLADYA
jgi:shikimate kinase